MPNAGSRAGHSLLNLFDEALSTSLSLEETFDIKARLEDLLLTITDDDLYQAGAALRRWLDDWDIRQRDVAYADAITSGLEKRYRAPLLEAQRLDRNSS